MNGGAPLVWKSGTIHAAGASVATFETGSGEPGAPVVVLLHGLGQWTDAAWGRLVPELPSGIRYLGCDLPGFGASEKPPAPYDLPYFRRVLDDLVAAYELRRFALLGHSLGAFLAADYAAAHPERVERLALVAPAGFSRVPRHVVYALAGYFARWVFTHRPSRRFVARTLARSVVDAASLDPALVERTYALAQEPGLRRAFAGVYAGALRTFADPRAVRTGFARYRGPVFCAWGARDRFIPVAGLQAVRAVYPHARTLVLGESGHLPMLEEPARLGAELRGFLAG
ncbi:MAG TPA: alpha/beta hydrolase [Candidatus Limnocylindria bacterium]|nr:alpha/beta hydrolase [Candidatus Limnocylindria bacterium]